MGRYEARDPRESRRNEAANTLDIFVAPRSKGISPYEKNLEINAAVNCKRIRGQIGTRFDLTSERLGASISPPSTDNHEVTIMTDASHREPAILRRKQVEARTGLARSTIYQYVKEGVFPKPVHLGPRAVGWIESEVSDWINDRIKSPKDNDPYSA